MDFNVDGNYYDQLYYTKITATNIVVTENRWNPTFFNKKKNLNILPESGTSQNLQETDENPNNSENSDVKYPVISNNRRIIPVYKVEPIICLYGPGPREELIDIKNDNN